MKLIAARIKVTDTMRKKVVVIAKNGKGWYRAVDEDGNFRIASAETLEFMAFLRDGIEADEWLISGKLRPA